MFLKNRDKFYWFETLIEHDLIYIQYNSCQEINSLSFEAFTDQIAEEINTINAFKKVVIDMRHNGGGNSSIMKPLINKLKDYVVNNRFTKENIYLIIGRKTFSSALLNSIEIKEELDNVVIGEPTGGKPNHYGEVRTFNLPNSNMKVYYSTKYFDLSDLNENSFKPDIYVDYNSEHFIMGIDPILERIKQD
jgi:C-terminal processing protease CtpA/Prc